MPLEEVESIEKPVKAKKPATDYQLANFKKGQEIRHQKAEEKEIQKAAVRELARQKEQTESDRLYNEKVAAGVAKGLAEAKAKPKPKKQVIVYEESDDEIEAPVIIKRKKPQPVNTSEDDYEPPTPPPPQAPRRLKRV